MSPDTKNSILRFAYAAETVTAHPVSWAGCVPFVYCLLMAVYDLSQGNYISAGKNGFLCFVAGMAVSSITCTLQEANDYRRTETLLYKGKPIPWYHALTPRNLLQPS